MKSHIVVLASLVLLAGCQRGMQVTYVSPHASSSTTYTCGDLERFWDLDSDGVEVLQRTQLDRVVMERLRNELEEIEFNEVVGGYFPVFKFNLGKDTYCVTSDAHVIKNDDEVSRSQEVYELLEQTVGKGQNAE